MCWEVWSKKTLCQRLLNPRLRISRLYLVCVARNSCIEYFVQKKLWYREVCYPIEQTTLHQIFVVVVEWGQVTLYETHHDTIPWIVRVSYLYISLEIKDDYFYIIRWLRSPPYDQPHTYYWPHPYFSFWFKHQWS